MRCQKLNFSNVKQVLQRTKTNRTNGFSDAELERVKQNVFNEFLMKYEMCEDFHVKMITSNFLKKVKNEKSHDAAELFSYDLLLDSVNAYKRQYCPIYSPEVLFNTYTPRNIDFYKKQVKELREDENFEEEETLHQKIEKAYSEPYRILRFEKRKNTKRILDELPNNNDLRNYIFEQMQNPKNPRAKKALRYAPKNLRKIIYNTPDLKNVLETIIKEPALDEAEMKDAKNNLRGYIYKRCKGISDEEKDFLTKYSSMKDLMAFYFKDSYTIEHLWKTYILSGHNREIKNILVNINEEFGTKIICDKDIDKEKLFFIREELRLWKTACKDEAKFPEVINISNYYDYRTDDCAATTFHMNNIEGKLIEIPGKNIKRNNCLRHEMAHVNDRFLEQKSKKAKKWEKYATLTEIPKFYLFLIDRAIKTIELYIAGIKSKHIFYAFKNSCEEVAVFMEAQTEKLSKWRIKQLKKKGLPNGIENLRKVSLKKCELLAKFPRPAQVKTIDMIDVVINGDYTDELVKEISNNPDFWSISRVCKECCKKGEKITPQEFIEQYRQHCQEN